MSSNFDKQLEKLLTQEASETVDKLDGEHEEETEEQQELTPIVYEKKESSLELSNEDLKNDYDSARSNLYGLIGDTNSAIKLALKVAAMSEHPRALEVASTLIKTSTDISKELLALHKAIEQKQTQKDPSQGSYTQINNYNYADKQEAEDILDELEDEKEANETTRKESDKSS